MIDLEPPEQFGGEEVLAALNEQLQLRDGGESASRCTFYDTFDGLLHRAGAAAAHSNGRLVLLDTGTGEELASLRIERPEKPLHAFDLQPCPMRATLRELAEVRALLPIVELESRSRAFAALDGEGKTVVRITLEQPAVVSAGGSRTALRPRLRLAAVRGYDAELRRALGTLEDALAFKRARRPLVEEAAVAAGHNPGGTSSRIAVRLDFGQRADAGAASVLGRLLEVIRANLEGAIADVDSEFLHDVRVAVRRSRSVLRELRGVFPPAELARLREEFKWLQQATGETRDLDVHVLEFEDYRALLPEPMQAELEPLLVALRSRRLLARRDMVRALRSERTTRLLADCSALLEELVELPADERPDAATSIGELTGHRVRRVYHQLLRMGRAIDSSSPPAQYHELRKKAKELRYLLELFGVQLYPQDLVRPLVRTLKSVQEVLGRHQDREVQIATLHATRDTVATLPGGAAALMAMGVLVDRLLADEQRARGEFAQRWQGLASRAQQRLVEEAFG